MTVSRFYFYAVICESWYGTDHDGKITVFRDRESAKQYGQNGYIDFYVKEFETKHDASVVYVVTTEDWYGETKDYELNFITEPRLFTNEQEAKEFVDHLATITDKVDVATNASVVQ